MDLTSSTLASTTLDSDDNKPNNAVFQKQTLKSYATRVFQESTIGIVSSIFTTHSKYRRFFKICFSSLCITGFIYHCITFLNHVFEYPEVVDISLDRSDTYDWPAYTYCNNNPIRKNLFCALYPQHCVKPSEEFCKKFPSYCGARPKLIPKEDYYYTLPDDFQFELMLRPRNVPNILMGSNSYLASRKGKKEEDEISGPYLRTSDFPHNSKACYSIHSVVESNQKPLQKRRGNSTFGITDDIMRFRVDEAQMMDPRIESGVYFSVHSPYEAANPLKKGIFLKSGRTYKLYVEMEKEILLKAPFESNCVDYEELWEKNNRTGPRTKKMCREKCFVDYRKLRHECVYATIVYPHKERICSKRIDGEATPRPVLEEETKFYEKCLEDCLNECRSYKYTTEFTMQYYISYIKEDRRHNYVDVTIHLSNEEVKVLKHSPKYETVDVFSSVGGFMGCWLGIALMDILDVFGSIVTVFRYALRKR